MTIADLLRDALLEIGTQDPIEPVGANEQALALTRLNGILDLWNAQQIATYVTTFLEETLTPNLDPHTIGSDSATFTVAQRPEAILGANLLIGSGASLVRIPIDIRDSAWWLAQPVPNIASSVPTDLYYATDWPNGSLYFWPVPTVAYGVELQVRYVVAQVADSELGDTFSMPPGYLRALMLTLAEDLTGPFSLPLTPALEKKAREARAVIFATNNVPVRIRTRDSGMPGGGAQDAAFNWMSRTWSGGR